MSSKNTPTRSIITLIALGFGLSMLALYQWMELLLYYAGGELSCALSDTVNCAAVWTTPFAKAVRSGTGMPVAGGGLVYGLAAFAAAIKLALPPLRGEAVSEGDAHVVRVVGVAGVVTSLALGAVSIHAGALCVLCVATYWLVFTYAFFALRLPGPKVPPVKPLLVAGAWVAAAFALLIVPGTRTPTEPATALAAVVGKDAKPAPAAAPSAPSHPSAAAAPQAPPDNVPRTLDALMARLPPGAKQSLSDALGQVRDAKAADASKWPHRLMWGEASAPVVFTEFTDILCGHCARLAEEMKELASLVPPGSFSVVPRQFPLDAECNPMLDKRMSDGSKTRCSAAKALICLESKPDAYWTAHHDLFAQQRALNNDKVMEISARHYGDRAALDECMGSKETAAQLADDIEYASKYDIHGTPMVLMNGREIPAMGAFLYAMILARGNPDAPAFASLPPARPPQPHDHGGHGHNHDGHGPGDGHAHGEGQDHKH